MLFARCSQNQPGRSVHKGGSGSARSALSPALLGRKALRHPRLRQRRQLVRRVSYAAYNSLMPASVSGACSRRALLLWQYTGHGGLQMAPMQHIYVAAALNAKVGQESQLRDAYSYLQVLLLHCCRRRRTCRARLFAPTGMPRHWRTWGTLSGRYAAGPTVIGSMLCGCVDHERSRQENDTPLLHVFGHATCFAHVTAAALLHIACCAH